MRKWARFALCGVLAAWGGLGAGGPLQNRAWGAGEASAAEYRAGVACFSWEDANAILKGLEEREWFAREAEACRRFQAEAEEAIEAGRVHRLELEARAVLLEKERDDALKAAADATKAGEEGIKGARGPWWRRAWEKGKWGIAGVAAGILLTTIAGGGR